MQGHVVREQPYCCDLIFCASLALIGGRADERTTAPSTGSLGIGSRVVRAGGVKPAAVATVVDGDATAVFGANTGSPARDARHPEVSMQHL